MHTTGMNPRIETDDRRECITCWTHSTSETTETTCSWSCSDDCSINTEPPIGYATSAYVSPERVTSPRASVLFRIASKATGSFSSSAESASRSESATGSSSDGLMFCRSYTTTRALTFGSVVVANCCFRYGSAGKLGIAARSDASRLRSSLFASEVR